MNLPHVVIPVRPGRDLALLVEVAALNQRLQKMGFHASRDLNQVLIEEMKKKTGHVANSAKIHPLATQKALRSSSGGA